MAEAAKEKEPPYKLVRVEALVLMKISKHCSSTFPSIATGAIVGLDRNQVLEVTNTFPFPVPEPSAADTQHGQHNVDYSVTAASAPRAKANIVYQADMIRNLKEVNVDANCVGWYTSATMGNFVTPTFIENQVHYQRENDGAAALVYDSSRSAQGATNLRAFRLSNAFLAAHKEGKFTTESLQKSKLTYRDILVEVPVQVRDSHILASYLHQLPAESPAADRSKGIPRSVAALEAASRAVPHPLFPSADQSLDLSVDPFLEKTCDLLLDSIEAHYSDLNNHQYYQRQLAREQAKIATWQARRKAENVTRAAQKQEPLPEDEWQRLFKLPQEPSRLEGMLNARQVEQYGKQVDGFTAVVSAKMFAVKGALLPE